MSVSVNMSVCRLFQTVYRHVHRLFTGCLQACLQTVYRHVYRLFTGMFTYFTDCLQIVYRMFTGMFKIVNRMFTGMFTDCLQACLLTVYKLFRDCLEACLQTV